MFDVTVAAGIARTVLEIKLIRPESVKPYRRRNDTMREDQPRGS
jgi:hypothetical protein